MFKILPGKKLQVIVAEVVFDCWLLVPECSIDFSSGERMGQKCVELCQGRRATLPCPRLLLSFSYIASLSLPSSSFLQRSLTKYMDIIGEYA
jgi:hypothetical protein